MSATDLPNAAFAAALASLPRAGPVWLSEVLLEHGPAQAWRRALAGLLPVPGASPGRSLMAEAAARSDVPGLWARLEHLGVTVTWPGAAGYPAMLDKGPCRAGVLFILGSPELVGARPTVAIVGTRQCTPEGATTAYELSRDLAAAGVTVVSGLALGIDGAAHAGALAAVSEGGKDGAVPGTTIGVAASGVDVVYPRQHTALWRHVARQGALVSEVPPGAPAQSWRFPARNRLIAGLSMMVVVVESHLAGGALHTVDSALRAGIEVGAVPGPVRCSACAGTNQLLHEGAVPIRHAPDVLGHLGIMPAGQNRGGASRAAGDHRTGAGAQDRFGPGPQFAGAAAGNGQAPSRDNGLRAREEPALLDVRAGGPLGPRVLDAVGRQPRCLDEVVERSGLPVGAVVVSLELLKSAGVLTEHDGWWSHQR